MKDEDNKKIKYSNGDTFELPNTRASEYTAPVSGIVGKIPSISNNTNFSGLTEINPALKITGSNYGLSSNLYSAGQVAVGPSGPFLTEYKENMFSYNNGRATVDSPSVFFAGPTGSKQLTPEEVEKIIEKKMSSNKGAELTMEDVKNVWKELSETTQIHEEGILNKGLETITKKLLEGGVEQWRCKRCTTPLDIFEGEGGVDKIKKYIVSFRNNVLKGCKNGHQNFFEVREDGMIWSVKTSFDHDFRFTKKKD